MFALPVATARLGARLGEAINKTLSNTCTKCTSWQNAIQPVDIISFCEDHANTDTGLGAALEGGRVWCPYEGDFAGVVRNAFLHHHSTSIVRLRSVADKLSVGSAPELLLSGLPADQNAFMLSWHQGTEAHQGSCRGHGHAVCIRKPRNTAIVPI